MNLLTPHRRNIDVNIFFPLMLHRILINWVNLLKEDLVRSIKISLLSKKHLETKYKLESSSIKCLIISKFPYSSAAVNTKPYNYRNAANPSHFIFFAPKTGSGIYHVFRNNRMREKINFSKEIT
ncbi:hypothetical protein BpHYR1_029639 [Brachionus plicatilis]|uniref:Uncharacterized protein n=1 Tax=Brachionus plicatilis TaxID=10195 RepID=A0A3M7T4R2_BRAPC|nr:hypothetical protein BpHYR1_029639 [Brachionus plicatilis]